MESRWELWGCAVAASSRAMACLGLLLAASCHGTIGPSAGPQPGPGGTPSGAAGSGAPPSTTPPPSVVPPTMMASGGANAPAPLARRLSDREYNNTVFDLLGTRLPAENQIEPTIVEGFSNSSSGLSAISENAYVDYLNAANILATNTFADATLAGRINTCPAPDVTCVSRALQAFATKAWRRPPTTEELAGLVAAYQAAVTGLGKDHAHAMQHVVRIVLSSPYFVYRFEFDSGKGVLAGTTLRPVDAWELASRLSYFLWTSMPDDTLFGLAANGQLLDTTVLGAQVTRMLASPKADGFKTDFLGEWLHMRELQGHSIDPAVFPGVTPALLDVMRQDASTFFDQFLGGGASYTEFLTRPVTVSPMLATLYAGEPAGVRQGFLTLPALLTSTSKANRTSPTVRGSVIMEALLCTPLAPPANVTIPPLESTGVGMNLNVRQKLALHRQDPNCAGCHALMDPIGLGLENFDGVGRYRTKWENGDTVDPSATLFGQSLANPAQLSTIVTAQASFISCAAQHIYSYVMGRDPVAADQRFIDQIGKDWAGGSFVALAQRTVAGDAFRFRAVAP